MKARYWVFYWTWCLPQTLLGSILFAWLRHAIREFSFVRRHKERALVLYSSRFRGAVSLGPYILLNQRFCDTASLNHEYGHTRQSTYLGPLYLAIIGLPSILWAYVQGRHWISKSYYWLYTERWADRLGGVKRKRT